MNTLTELAARSVSLSKLLVQYLPEPVTEILNRIFKSRLDEEIEFTIDVGETMGSWYFIVVITSGTRDLRCSLGFTLTATSSQQLLGKVNQILNLQVDHIIRLELRTNYFIELERYEDTISIRNELEFRLPWDFLHNVLQQGLIEIGNRAIFLPRIGTLPAPVIGI